MPVQFPDLDALDATAVAQNLSQVIERVNEDNPALDLRPGVLYSILAYYNAALAAGGESVLQQYLNARSLLVLNADPALASDDLVDDVLSNYLLTREPGSQATGEVVIVLSSDTTAVIGVGAVFTANGLTFTAAQTYVAQPNAAQLSSPSDVLLTQLSNGNWAFTITVNASAVGAAYAISKAALLVPSSPPSNFVTAYAASDFTGGSDAETNAALLARLQQGVAAVCLANRATSAGLLRSVAEFAQFAALSIVGMGDAEMLRDKHSILPVALGGRVDWYLRTQPAYQNLLLTKTAVLIGFDVDGFGFWQLAIVRDDAPGYYEFSQICVAGTDPTTIAGGFNVTSDVRGVDLTGVPYAPDVVTTAEGAYSRYQTAIITFKDDVTNVSGLAVGAQGSYNVTAKGLPMIDAVQDYILTPDVRNRSMDCLVKAPIPCFVSLTFTIFKQTGQPDPDTASMIASLCAAVHAVSFTGRLYASALQDVVYGYLSNATSVSSIDMLARIRYPSGAVRWLNSREVIAAPYDPAAMVSPRTVQFFTTVEDIAVSIVTSVPSDG